LPLMDPREMLAEKVLGYCVNVLGKHYADAAFLAARHDPPARATRAAQPLETDAPLGRPTAGVGMEVRRAPAAPGGLWGSGTHSDRHRRDLDGPHSEKQQAARLRPARNLPSAPGRRRARRARPRDRTSSTSAAIQRWWAERTPRTIAAMAAQTLLEAAKDPCIFDFLELANRSLYRPTGRDLDCFLRARGLLCSIVATLARKLRAGGSVLLHRCDRSSS
jgi:hypothetical protein